MIGGSPAGNVLMQYFEDYFFEEHFFRNIFWTIFFQSKLFSPAGNVFMQIFEEYFFSDAHIFSPRLRMFSCNIIMEYLLWECFNVIVRGIFFL